MTVVTKPTAGEVEQRSAPDVALTVAEGRLRGVIPYNTESRDLGGWTEVIEPGALACADMDDLVATLNHQGVPLGRFDSTLQIEDRDDGLHWSVELGDGPTAQDVRAAVERGDLRESSWRMVVGKDSWTGNTRRITEIRSLRDVAVVTTGAYPADATRVEIRERPEPPAPTTHQEEVPMKPNRENGGGGLAVEDRQETGGADIESRVLDAMAAVPKGEVRDLTHATAEPVTPPELSTHLWDLLRTRSVVLASGVPVITTDKKEVTWPALKADMSVAFYGELEEIAQDEPEFEDFTLKPAAIKGLARGSSEAFEDSDPDLLRIVRDNLTVVMGLKFDAEALVGGSSKGFNGLTKLAGQELNMAEKGFEDYDPIIAAMGLLAEAHVPGPYAAIMHPRVATAIDRLKEFNTEETNVPLQRPTGLPEFWVSSQLPIKSASEKPDLTSVIVYAPKSLVCVRRRDVTIEVDRSQEFKKDAVFVRGRARATLGTQYPEAIVHIKNVKSPAITL